MAEPGTFQTILEGRYGAPIKSTDKVVAFQTGAGRQLCLERGKNLRLWLEDVLSPPPPGAQRYQPTQGRHSNLPDKLRHEPNTDWRAAGFPKPVVALVPENEDALRTTLDRYDALPPVFDRQALLHMRAVFLRHFPGFKTFTDDAGVSGSFAAEESAFKAQRIERIRDALNQVSANPATSPLPWLTTLITATQAKPGETPLVDYRFFSGMPALLRTDERIAAALAVFVRSCDDPVVAFDGIRYALEGVLAENSSLKALASCLRAFLSLVLAAAHPSRAMAVQHTPSFQAARRLLGHEPWLGPLPTGAEYERFVEMGVAAMKVMRDEWGWQPRDLWDVQGFLWVACGGYGPNNGANKVSEQHSSQPPATNRILYGPPGTGKTYTTAELAVRICDGELPAGDYRAVKARYDELRRAERIEFVTFHQSYAYEDFVEGLRPETGTTGGNGTGGSAAPGLRLEVRDGVFKRIANRARGAKRLHPADDGPMLDGRTVWKMSLGEFGNEDHAPVFTDAIREGYIALGWGSELDLTEMDQGSFPAAMVARLKDDGIEASEGSGYVRFPRAFRWAMKPSDVIIVSQGNHRFRAVGVVASEYKYQDDAEDFRHRRKVQWLWSAASPGQARSVSDIYDGQFVMGSLYRLDQGALKLPALQELLAPPGRQGDVPALPYVLVIDEINRANVSKVFGELITLIEPDKREDAPNSLSVTLPYSGETFSVPGNLHLVGTMNSADRSVALIDTALRRRFEFQEVPPDPNVLRDKVIEGVDLSMLLQRINERVEYLLDRDHLIGHAFLTRCITLKDLDHEFRHTVIPLLAEYFHDDWDKLRAVLNETAEDGRFIIRSRLPTPQGMEDGVDRFRYRVRVEPFTADAFKALIG